MTAEIAKTGTVAIPLMDLQSIERLGDFRRVSLSLPQIDPNTQHVLHAGLYHRTVKMPAGTVMVGVLVKIPTTVIIAGDVSVWLGEVEHRFTGYHVLAAAANRMQAFIAHQDTFITMSFATKAGTVEEAENEFTDEHGLLMSRRGFGNEVRITGE